MRPQLVDHTEASDQAVFVEQVEEPRWRGRCRYCHFATKEMWWEEGAAHLLEEHFATPEHSAAVIAFVVDEHSRRALYPEG
jgi:hypothetical protein